MSRWEQVIDKAKELRRDFHSDAQPLQETFQKICDANNIKIVYAPSGEHAYQGESESEIVLPLGTSRARDNFTIEVFSGVAVKIRKKKLRRTYLQLNF